MRLAYAQNIPDPCLPARLLPSGYVRSFCFRSKAATRSSTVRLWWRALIESSPCFLHNAATWGERIKRPISNISTACALHVRNIRAVRSKHSCSLIIWTTSLAMSLGNFVGYDGWWSCLPREISSKNGNRFHFTGIYRSNRTLHLWWRTRPGPCGWSKPACAQHMLWMCGEDGESDLLQNFRFEFAAPI